MGNTNVKEAITKIVSDRFGSRANDGQFQQGIDVVSTALQQALDSAVETLREGGSSLGASDEDVNDLLAEAGLVTEDEPEQQPETDEAPAWAKQYMAKVDKLVDLARSRLGANI